MAGDNLLSYRTSDTYIHETLNVSPWVLVIIVTLLVGLLVIRELRKPKLPIFKMKPKKQDWPTSYSRNGGIPLLRHHWSALF
ncbi:hypothetical protein ACFX4I_17540 [Peribacillus sp. YIM B13472]|uniref:hypothetical protein n=1 Tax=Peribacillus sp. YIM B13472 TaxID=3366297 RepID=UPI00366D4807